MSATTSTKKQKQIEIPRSTIASWVLYSIRRTIGEEDVRNAILKKLVPANPKRIYGKTFVVFIDENKPLESQQTAYYKRILKYLDTITGPKYKDMQVCITIANFPAKVELDTDTESDANNDTPLYETHYITLIINNDVSSRNVIYMDPARTPSGDIGIYESLVIPDVLHKYFETKKYVEQYKQVTAAAQTTYDDVFCQSWSLYLMKETLLGKDTIEIPSSKKARYELLLSFWKEANKSILFQTVLREDFTSLIDIDIAESLSNDSNKNKLILSFYRAFDPVEFLASMTPNDVKL